MKNRKKKLPIGIENFEKLQSEGFYYIDKTSFIQALLEDWAEVNLFTRPRRFGKSLNMSMLKSFFELGTDPGIFQNLAIAEETALCEEYMGQFPVISVSLKGINGNTYQMALDMADQLIRAEARRFQYLLDSEKLTDHDKEALIELLRGKSGEGLLCSSLKILSELLEKHHDCPVILLIDEYDVPLAKAFEHGYYDQMVTFIRNMLEYALKTNDSLKFAVLTGCMIAVAPSPLGSKVPRQVDEVGVPTKLEKTSLSGYSQSIFTGLNNLKVLSVTDVQFDEFFGFTDREVRDMLEYYELSGHYGEMKEWYDGYQFGNVEVYCPWDVINYCDALRADPEARPKNYWLNTSSNEAVRRFIRESENAVIRKEIEKLVAGEVIVKEIHPELTYKEMYASVENLWSVLFTTGYLTQRGRPEGDAFPLAIPNVEIRNIFTTQIMEFFKETVPKNGEMLEKFCTALLEGDAGQVESLLGGYLRRTISIRDTFVQKRMKENFYHGILVGILGFADTWGVSSNKESGDGYSDILIETDDGENGIILELKYAEDGKLEDACRAALQQAEDKRYEEMLLDDGVEHILKYGIAFYKKRCRVMLAAG